MTPAKQLKDLLQRTRACIPNGDFCGVGVVVCSSLDRMPIASLCIGADLPIHDDLAQQIAECSLHSNPCHDGFQLISSQWELVARNQYFAPFPLDEERGLSRTNDNVGSRYMAARLGSLIDTVLCTGLLSERDGLVVFVRGVPDD
jgi:hypothetical protein